jgi:hypothetical protein
MVVDKWNTTRFWRFLSHLQDTLLKRELTGEEIRLSSMIYYTSLDGWKKTRQRIRRALARHWNEDRTRD